MSRENTGAPISVFGLIASAVISIFITNNMKTQMVEDNFWGYKDEVSGYEAVIDSVSVNEDAYIVTIDGTEYTINYKDYDAYVVNHDSVIATKHDVTALFVSEDDTIAEDCTSSYIIMPWQEFDAQSYAVQMFDQDDAEDIGRLMTEKYFAKHHLSFLVGDDVSDSASKKKTKTIVSKTEDKINQIEESFDETNSDTVKILEQGKWETTDTNKSGFTSLL